jgi:hypothetical protein
VPPLPRSLGVVEYTTMLVAAIIGDVLFVWPGHVVEAAGENALGSIGFVIMGVFVIGLLHHQVVQRSQDRPALRGLLRLSAGLGMALVGLMDLALITLLTQMLHTLFYAETPRWALLLPVLAMVAWGSGIALDALGRLMQLWVPLGGALLAAIAAIGLIHATHVRPLWPQQWYLRPMLHGTGVMAYLLVPVGPAVACLAPHVNAAGDAIRRGFLAAAGVLSLTLLAIYVLVTLMLGPNAIPHLRWPLVYSLESITLDSTFFISRVGLAVIFLWTAVVALAFAVHLRLTVLVCAPRGRAVPFWLSGGLGSLYGIGLMVFPTPSASTHWILRDMDPIALGYLIVAQGLLSLGLVVGTRRRPHRIRRSPHPDGG